MKIGVENSGVLDVLGIEDGFAALENAGFEVVDFNMCHYIGGQTQIAEANLKELFDEARIKEYFDGVKAAAEKHGIGFGQCHAPYPIYIPKK